MPKITEIFEVLSTPNNCPFDAVCGVVSVAYPATEIEGKRGPYLIQNIEYYSPDYNLSCMQMFLPMYRLDIEFLK